MTPSGYHAGERQMQQLTGEEMPAYRNARMVVPFIAAGAGNYMEQQPFLIVSSQDERGRIWTSILSGEEGYVKVLDEKTLRLTRHLTDSNPDDVFWQNSQSHPFIGMLFIEPATRRRYRINGQLRTEQDQMIITVNQAYGNCPKYIQRRSITREPAAPYPVNTTHGTALTDELTSWIKSADTFFVGSSNGQEELDASHRGGNPGFIEVLGPSLLRIPDYEGNSMYNTLGNFLVYPKAGLLFVDFTTHKMLQLTGTAKVTQQNSQLLPSGNTGRFWTFQVEEWVLLENILRLESTFTDYSPFNPPTGGLPALDA